MRRTVILVTAVLMAAGYTSTLRGMFDQWWNDEDMGHGLVVPFVIGWILWRERKRWRALQPQPTWWGFGLLVAGAGLQAGAAAGAGLFAASLGFLVTIAGAVLCLGGFAFLRVWSFPFLLAVFMLPKLAVVYNQATLPLQLLASRMAAGMLSAGGLAVVREGNILATGGHRVLVAEACNGVRYLLSLGFMSQVIAYVSDSKPWMRVVLLLAAVPVAILANAVRVAAVVPLPILDAGVLHAIFGCLIFVACLATLVLVRRDRKSV